MGLFPLTSDRVSLSITEVGGQLSEVSFTLGRGRRIRPMHIAPWFDEPLGDDIAPVLRVLRGDFFCAPFSVSDLLKSETRDHGRPANGVWRLARSDVLSLDAVLDGDVMGASVTKHVAVRPGETVVYQRHTLAGGAGRLPIGHQAMLSAQTKLKLSFGRWIWAGTPPEPIVAPPAGRCLRAAGQTINDLTMATLMADGRIDLTEFPTIEDHDDIWMLAADTASAFGWTSATSTEQFRGQRSGHGRSRHWANG